MEGAGDMVEKKETGVQGQQKNDDDEIKTEARRKAKEDGRDWQSLSKEERKAYREEAREKLGKK
jgi:hypothetical protein